MARRACHRRSAMDADSPSQKVAICKCNVCSGDLEFDAARAGETVQCPHCGAETALYIPKPKKTAKIISEKVLLEGGIASGLEKGLFGGGVESGLEAAGGCLLIVGVFGAVVALCAAGGTEKCDWGIFAVGMAALLQGAVLYVFFRGMAEIIRLLKKANGLPFSGTISGPEERTVKRTVLRCSNCKQILAAGVNAKECVICGAELVKDNDTTQS